MAISRSLLGKLFHVLKRRNAREDFRKNAATGRDDNGLIGIPEVYPYGSRSLSAQVAAVKTLCPTQDRILDAHRRTFSADFECFASAPNRTVRKPRSVHILRGDLPQFGSLDLEVNRPRRLSRKQSTTQLSTGFSNGDLLQSLFELPDQTSLSPRKTDTQSTSRRNAQSLSPSPSPTSLQVPKKAVLPKRPLSMCSPILAYEERPSSLSRKPDVSNLRTASEYYHVRSFSLPVHSNNSRLRILARSPITRADLDKPLPLVPLEMNGADQHARRNPRDARQSASDMLPPMSQHLQLSPNNEDQHAESDITYYRTWSPAVTHETITRHLHDIREEHITRNIHEHDVYYRTLPIVDVEILPARHFVPSESGLIEIAEEDVPEDMRPSEEWIHTKATSGILQDECELDSSEESIVNATPPAATEATMERTAAVQTESTHYHPVAIGSAIPGTQRVYAVSVDASDWCQDL